MGHLKLQAEIWQLEWEVVEKAVVSLRSFSMKGNWRYEVLSSENSESPLYQLENTAFVF